MIGATRVLLTGMSGVGKSTVATELKRRGFAVIDTDHDAYRVADDGEWLWDEVVVDAFLADDSMHRRFVIGTASNQVGFYDRFDHIVLLTAPTEVMVERIRTRTDNPFGQTDDEMTKVLADKETFEPMLRKVADTVVDTDRPLEQVVDDIVSVCVARDAGTLRAIVLASASPRRLDLLRQIGIEPVVEPADVDETLDAGVDVAAAVAGLAADKARAVARRHRGERVLVLGADTLVVLDGQPLGKPRDGAEAREMLGRLSGREHQVMTGVALIDAATGSDVGGVETTVVRFRDLDPDEIAAYVATGEPLDKAGAYGIQGGAAVFVAELTGDHSNVVGLPLRLVQRLLGEVSARA